MSLLSFAAKISSLEKRLNRLGVDSYLETFWPLIRMRLLEAYQVRGKVTKQFRMRRILTLLASLITPLGSLPQSDLFVLSAESDFGPKKYFHRKNTTIEAIAKLLDTEIVPTCANTATLGVLQVVLRKGGVSLLKHVLFARVSAQLRLFFSKVRIPDQRDISSQIEEVFGFSICLRSDLLLIEELAARFEKLLVQVRPSLVMVSVWFSREAMAMILASKRLNIQTVDYQHGAQNDLHPMYTNWSLRSENGFGTMPNVFWTWGDISNRRINNWATHYENHRAILGGRLYDDDRHEDKKPTPRWLPKHRNNNPIIYVTLQGDGVFNNEIFEVLEGTNQQMNWVFRDHPRLPISPALKRKILSASGMSASFVKGTTLQQDLIWASVHVTGFSTCAFEAEVLGVPTIFIHESAPLSQPELLGRQGFLFCHSGKEIIAGLHRLINHKETPSSNYIEQTVDSKAALQTLMSWNQ